uniref:hepcidin-1 n=1 Tax=Doryrhamphus excisus TaxID=161450 RepID=UPI0025AE6E21|nr:hepcidin-1 [Doryrhamphus excisus]
MKACSIAVAVTLVLAFLCAPATSAVPFSGVQQVEEAGGHAPAAALPDVPSQMAYGVRRRRQSNLSLCRWCCDCCQAYKGCGFCCRF